MTTSMIVSRHARIAGLSCGLVLLAGCAAFRTADNELAAASRHVATENLVFATPPRNSAIGYPH